jgi:serine phosphatase RsbU (regulator of sigma subunit)
LSAAQRVWRFAAGAHQIEGFEIAGTWEPARIVGGDYFDVIRLSEKKLGR